MLWARQAKLEPMGARRMQIEQIPLGPVCLFHSLHPSLVFSSPSSLSFSQCVKLSCLFALASISLFVHLFPPPPFCPSRTQHQGRVSAKWSRALVNLCVLPCALADSPLLADPSSSPRDGRQLSVALLHFLEDDWDRSLTPRSTPSCPPPPLVLVTWWFADFCLAG